MHQITRSPSYLIRNPHSYCFRMSVPADLRPLIGKRELRYSLQTGYLRTAKSRARVIAGQVQLVFQEMRRNFKGFMKLSDQQIQNMVTRYLERSKAAMDQPLGPYDGDRPFKGSSLGDMGSPIGSRLSWRKGCSSWNTRWTCHT